MASPTGQPWHVLKSWYTVGAGAQMELTRGLVLSVALEAIHLVAC